MSIIPERALEDHVAILGKTGAGKSNAAKTVVEQLLDAGERVCIIDPTGTWYGLRLLPNRKPSKFAVVIFGGHHADVPIGGQHGAAIATAIGTSHTSCIIDTRLLSVRDRTRFFTDFAEELLRSNQGTLHLVMDEAHLFAPKGKVNDPASGIMLGAANNLLGLGRGIGLRIMLLSQRASKVHNDCLGQVETLVAMRMTLPHDRAAVKEWIKEQADEDQGREIMASLAGLPTGDAWVWWPQGDVLERAHFELASTFDSGRAQKAGVDSPELAPLDMKAITERLEQVAADVIANDPKTLKAEILQLRRELVARPAVASAEELEAAKQRGYHEGWLTGIGEARTHGLSCFRQGQVLMRLRAGNVVSDLGAQIAQLATTEEHCPTLTDESPPPITTPPARAKPARRQAEPETSTAPATVRPPVSGATTQKVLDALAELESLGVATPPREFVTMLAGYSNVKSSGIANAFSILRGDGRIQVLGDGRMCLTDSGRAEAVRAGAPLSGDDMRRRIVAMLGSPVDKVLDVLVEAYPEAVDRATLAMRTGYSNVKSSGFAKAMVRLRSLGFMEVANGEARAAESLFPAGR